jgi:hypothetical protein
MVDEMLRDEAQSRDGERQNGLCILIRNTQTNERIVQIPGLCFSGPLGATAHPQITVKSLGLGSALSVYPTSGFTSQRL